MPPPKSPWSVLAVEDDPLARRLVSRILRGAGFATRSAADAASARRELASALPDAVLLDLGLPDANGLELLREIRSLAAARGLVVVVFTGRRDPQEERRCLELGADSYLGKPHHDWDSLPLHLLRLLRRAGHAGSLRIGELTLDLRLRNASAQGRPLPLSAKEFDLLVAVAERSPRVSSWASLHRRLWGPRSRVSPKSSSLLQVTLSHLRAKLRRRGVDVLRTARGKGLYLSLSTGEAVNHI